MKITVRPSRKLACPAVLTLALCAAVSAQEPPFVFSTYLPDLYSAEAVAVDFAGATYIGGTFGGPFGSAVVMKLSPVGEIVYSKVFGPGESGVQAISVDASGRVYATGFTNEPSSFPQIDGLHSSYRGSGREAFIVKLDPSGELVYSTTLGAAGREAGWGIGTDASGAIYVAGETWSPDFPKVHSLPLSSSASTDQPDVFVAKLVPGNQAPVWSIPLGGTNLDWPEDFAADAAGNSYLTGYTYSADFPTVNAVQGEHSGRQDVFVLKLSPGGDRILYSTFLGGSGDDVGSGIDVDTAGNVWLGGFTNSDDFPLLAALQTTQKNGDGFVVGLSPGGSLLFSTYFGGSYSDQVTGISVQRSGILHLAGLTDSAQFPLVEPIRNACTPVFPNGIRCELDAFVARIDPSLSRLLFSSYFGGSASDFARGIAVDSRGNASVVGFTTSRDFPLVNAISNQTSRERTAFVTRFLARNQLPICSAAFASPAMAWPPNGRLVPITIRNVIDPDGNPLALTVTGVRQDEPLTKPGTPDSTGAGTPNVSIRADRKGQGDGRVYHIAFEASDSQGGVCTGTVTVCVPHDQGRGRACGDGGPLFNSDGR